MLLAVVEEHFEESDEGPLFGRREPGQRQGMLRHPREHPFPQSGAGGREIEDFDTAVLGRRAAPHQSPRFQTVDEPGDVRGVAGECFCESTHGHVLPRFDQMQHVALHRREAGDHVTRWQMVPLQVEEPHEQLPGAARMVLG